MTNREAVNWLINIIDDIGKAEHRDLWHYEQALSEIREMLEAQTEHEKAQLSQEGTTSDTISRQEALDIFDDYNVSVENGELEAYSRDRKRLCELPTIQPQSTAGQLNDSAQSTNLIDRQQALEKVRAMQTYKLFEGDDMILVDKAEVQTELMMLPPVQPEVLACGNGELVAKPDLAAGEWIVHLYKVGFNRYECDTCHARCDIIYPYCPYCGEKKEGERYAIN